MSHESLADFLAMGGHGLYVWLAYGSTLIVLVALSWWPVAEMSRWRRTALRQVRATTAPRNGPKRREERPDADQPDVMTGATSSSSPTTEA